MENSTQLAKRVREVFLNGTFVANTNFKEQLENMNWELAEKAFAPLNTIARLSQHVHYYIKGVKQVLEGESLTVKDSESFNFSIFQSQIAWESFLAEFWNDAEKFALLVEQMPEEKLRHVFVKEKYGTYQRNIDSIIEHSYYHLGQITLLKKLALQNTQ